jgi:hypothetical protein
MAILAASEYEYKSKWAENELANPLYIYGGLGETKVTKFEENHSQALWGLVSPFGATDRTVICHGYTPALPLKSDYGDFAFIRPVDEMAQKAPSATAMPWPSFLGRQCEGQRGNTRRATQVEEAKLNMPTMTNCAAPPQAPNDDDGIRTIMMRNIPCRCTKDDLFEAIEELGFAGTYEFFHLPIKRCQRQNYGYAFIGFHTAEVTTRFCKVAEGYKFRGRKSVKAVTLVPARLQGLNEIIEHFKDTKVLNSTCPPIFIMRDGEEDPGPSCAVN